MPLDWNDLINQPPALVEFDTNQDEMFAEWKIPLVLHNSNEAEMQGCKVDSLPCPSSGTCIGDGYCSREYDAWSKRPHVWRGDYA